MDGWMDERNKERKKERKKEKEKRKRELSMVGWMDDWGKERKGKKGKERKGKERKGKERKGKERKGVLNKRQAWEWELMEQAACEMTVSEWVSLSAELQHRKRVWEIEKITVSVTRMNGGVCLGSMCYWSQHCHMHESSLNGHQGKITSS